MKIIKSSCFIDLSNTIFLILFYLFIIDLSRVTVIILFNLSMRFEILSDFNNNIEILFNVLILIIGDIVGIFLFLILKKAKKYEKNHSNSLSRVSILKTTYLLHSLLICVVVIIIPFLDFGLSLLKLPMKNPYSLINPTKNLLANPVYIILWISLLSFFSPIVEELIFRRIFITELNIKKGLSPEFSLLITSLLFALIHSPADIIYGSLRFTIIHFVGTFSSGLAFGYIFIITNKVKWAILLHSIQNTLAAILQTIIVYFNLSELSFQLVMEILSLSANYFIFFLVLLWVASTIFLGIIAGGWVIAQVLIYYKRKQTISPYSLRAMYLSYSNKEIIRCIFILTVGFLLLYSLIPEILSSLISTFAYKVNILNQSLLLSSFTTFFYNIGALYFILRILKSREVQIEI